MGSLLCARVSLGVLMVRRIISTGPQRNLRAGELLKVLMKSRFYTEKIAEDVSAMSFDYDKITKRSSEHTNFWTSYSDLFLMLSTVFLMLYVIASLKSGTYGIQKNMEYQRLSKEAQDLKEQIRVYNALRDEQLQNSGEEEQQVYAQLMDKLKLLQEEAKHEKEDLRRQAKENEQKEMALNKYQQLVRNIINTNILAKSQIKRRDQIIVKKEDTIAQKEVAIAQKDDQIQDLSTEVAQKEQMIEENQQKIDAINNALANKIKTLRAEQSRAKMSKQALQKAIADLKNRSEEQVRELETRNRMASQELNQVKTTLDSAQAKLTQTVAQVEQVKAQSEAEKRALVAQLEKTRAGYQNQIESLRREGESRLAAERAEFQRNLAKTKLTAAQKAQREAEFRAQAEAKANALSGRLQDLEGKVRSSSQQLEAAKQGEARAMASVEGLKKANEVMGEDLRKAKEIAEAKRNLARQIQANFKKAGIQAQVDTGTGDVTLTFPDDYFGTGQAMLTEGMQKRLNTFIPSYTSALFSDPKTAEKISNVEIIGFASPTFKGKYVNPQSLKAQDREAVEYNLKLSFNRANSIFKHIFDTTRLKYKHQEDLLPMVKVVGRGYLPAGKQGSDIPSGLPESEFCKRYNCNQAQKVVIKFNLKD